MQQPPGAWPGAGGRTNAVSADTTVGRYQRGARGNDQQTGGADAAAAEQARRSSGVDNAAFLARDAYGASVETQEALTERVEQETGAVGAGGDLLRLDPRAGSFGRDWRDNARGLRDVVGGAGGLGGTRPGRG